MPLGKPSPHPSLEVPSTGSTVCRPSMGSGRGSSIFLLEPQVAIVSMESSSKLILLWDFQASTSRASPGHQLRFYKSGGRLDPARCAKTFGFPAPRIYYALFEDGCLGHGCPEHGIFCAGHPVMYRSSQGGMWLDVLGMWLVCF